MAAVTILPKKCRSHITWWMVLRNASRSKLQQVCSHFHSFYFLFSSASCAFTFLLITLKWELRPRHDLGESSSGCDVPFTAIIKKKKDLTIRSTWKTADLNSWIAWKTKLDLWSNFWTDENLHGSAFRLHGTRGTVQVFEVTAKCACFCPD